MECESILANAFERMENEILNENYFLANLVMRAVELQILKRTFPTRSKILASFVLDTSSIVQVYFSSHLRAKISASEVHILSSFPTSFQRFSLKFGENVAR